MAERQTCIVGSSFYRGAGDLIGRLRSGNPLIIKRQPENKYDKNAVAVFWGAKQLGHIPRGLAAELAPIIDGGVEITATKAGPWGVIILTWPDQTEEVPHAESN